jgi:hypothetical protein
MLDKMAPFCRIKLINLFAIALEPKKPGFLPYVGVTIEYFSKKNPVLNSNASATINFVNLHKVTNSGNIFIALFAEIA